MYRFTVLFAIEALKQSCCTNLLNDDRSGSRSTNYSIRSNNDEPNTNNNKRNNTLVLAIAYLVQAILTTFAIFACLIGIKTLPLCYVIISLNITHLAFTSLEKMVYGKRNDTHTMLSLLLAMVTVVCSISSVQLLSHPQAKAAPISAPGLHD